MGFELLTQRFANDIDLGQELISFCVVKAA